MLDPVREKCDLHIRAAGIFFMQLELLEIQRLVALSHNEGATVDEESIFATAQRGEGQLGLVSLLSWMSFAFAVVPKAELCARTDSAGTADDYAKEVAQKMFRRIHAQFPG
jgi:hypothetical protein